MTILPVLNMSAVVLCGSFILIITAANLFGLYSAFLQNDAIYFRSNSWLRSAVETRFCNIGACNFGSALAELYLFFCATVGYLRF
jgi:hypothetical protein